MSTPEIERLVDLLAKLPGLGPRSARRAALHLIKRPGQLMQPLAEAIASAANAIRTCTNCGNVGTVDPCRNCGDRERARARRERARRRPRIARELETQQRERSRGPTSSRAEDVDAARDVTARDVMDTARVGATTAALERLQEVLGS